ncbi:lysosomal Pro-X carboxypeptidase [Neocloeon triangulifer]|uniref:lysosomal Pro-X carboxypeptidase n=1 Tax=Neocloeon triangulifer TaxID=2078957 RepID=UPI00286EC7E6|nr:lysosomal Pro-X carboxypeptidase [Neocloeon triangulifer]XP_059489333.1 lysosomal Pro-X carboxypeptidase [Neocloeon triangulifer]
MFIVWMIFLFFTFREGHGYQYETKYFTVPVDHFSFALNATFKMRYLVNNTHWNQESGPILFYTGNEGDIKMFAENTGFMWELAEQLKASVVFAEHRYYGESLPFGNKSFSSEENLGYLTAHQALEDYVDLITNLRGAKDIPVISFGGSYGGMLTAWFRMKYPHIVQGAIAASAPILEFEGMNKCSAFYRIVSSDFRSASDECADSVRNSWGAIDQLAKSADGLAWLSKAWSTCKPLTKASDITDLKDWLVDVYTNLAMTDYPYPTSFLMPLPANPILEVCQYLRDPKLGAKELLGQIFKGVSVYFNYTGKAKCLDVESADGALGDQGWDFQACTEMVMPVCSDGVNDMFEAKPWDLNKYSADCTKKFAWVKPQPDLVAKRYGGREMAKLSSNIIFSNGLRDPWTSGGVVESLAPTVLSIIIPEGAHHLDLRASNVADPDSVKNARNLYKKHIRNWIRQYKEK